MIMVCHSCAERSISSNDRDRSGGEMVAKATKEHWRGGRFRGRRRFKLE